MEAVAGVGAVAAAAAAAEVVVEMVAVVVRRAGGVRQLAAGRSIVRVCQGGK